MTHEQRYRAAPTIPARSPCKHAPHRAGRAAPRRAAYSRTSGRCLSYLATSSTPPLATATPAALLSAAVRKKDRAARRRSVFLTSVRRSPSCRPSQPASARCAVGSPSAPAAAAPPHHAPAAAVERLGKARRRAPFVRPATVRGRVGGRIGPLVHGVAVVREQKSKSLCRDHWARARAPSPRPFSPHSVTPPDRAAAARGHFCHTPSVQRWSGASAQRGGSIGRTAGRPSLTHAQPHASIPASR